MSVIVLNTALPVLGFTMAQKRIQKEMKRFILGNVPSDKLELIEVSIKDLDSGCSGLVFIHEREFRLNGKMYDIVRKESCADSVRFYVVNDTLEEKLIESFTSYIKDSFGDELGRLKARIIKQVKLFTFDYCPDIEKKCVDINCGYEIFNISSISPDYIYLDIPTPPPKACR